MQNTSLENLAASTQCTITHSQSCDELPIRNIFLIYCQKNKSKGTGFLLSNGVIVTNEHVIRGCLESEIEAYCSEGNIHHFKQCITDASRDLALLIPKIEINGGLEIDTSNLNTRQEVHTWGFPLIHKGPNPLLSVGYVSGFQIDQASSKRIIVNGAFNPGNSGGPLFREGEDKVVGIVVAKWNILLTTFQASALEALKKNKSGLQFSAKDGQGNTIPFSESQLIADILQQYLNCSQVMIGEAIPAFELKEFLAENSIPETE